MLFYILLLEQNCSPRALCKYSSPFLKASFHLPQCPATSCFSATSTSTTACVVAQMGKPIGLNTTKKCNTFFSQASLFLRPQWTSHKTCWWHYRLREDGRRRSGGSCLGGSGIRSIFSPVPFCFHHSASIYNL